MRFFAKKMSIKAILFDLDGTLLPMDQDLFVKTYIGGLVTATSKRGYDPKEMASAIMAGTAAMVKNRGDLTNEEVFWKVMRERMGERILSDLPVFDEFYEKDFIKVKDVLGFDKRAAEVVRLSKGMGLRVALATNPLFPVIATESRIKWAGLSPEEFELFTTYETSSHCKPNPDYYREVLSAMGLSGEECLMVGNDVDEDMIAESLGMKVFLLTGCLINRRSENISRYPHGDFDELSRFIEGLNR